MLFMPKLLTFVFLGVLGSNASILRHHRRDLTQETPCTTTYTYGCSSTLCCIATAVCDTSGATPECVAGTTTTPVCSTDPTLDECPGSADCCPPGETCGTDANGKHTCNGSIYPPVVNTCSSDPTLDQCSGSSECCPPSQVCGTASNGDHTCDGSVYPPSTVCPTNSALEQCSSGDCCPPGETCGTAENGDHTCNGAIYPPVSATPEAQCNTDGHYWCSEGPFCCPTTNQCYVDSSSHAHCGPRPGPSGPSGPGPSPVGGSNPQPSRTTSRSSTASATRSVANAAERTSVIGVTGGMMLVGGAMLLMEL